MKFYVYIHRRKSDNKPFYVGKGSGNRAWWKHKRNAHWNNVVNKHGYIVELVFEDLDEDTAFQCEKDTILELKYFGYPLVNMTDGGDGPSGRKPTSESRQKMSTAQKTSEKVKVAREQAANKRRGTTHAHGNKISKAMKGKSKTPEHIEAARLAKCCKKIYIFASKAGDEFQGTRKDFENYSKLTRIQVSYLFGKRATNSIFGWSIKMCII